MNDNQRNEAEKFLLLADSLYQYENYRQDIQPDIYHLKSILSLLYSPLIPSDKSNLNKSIKYEEAALAIAADLFKKDTLAYGDIMLHCKQTMISKYRYLSKNCELADSLCFECLNLLRILSKKQPQKYLSQLASMLGEYTSCNAQDLDKAEKVFLEAEAIWLKLTFEFPNNYWDELASIQSKLGRTALKKQDNPKAEHYLQLAKVGYEKHLSLGKVSVMGKEDLGLSEILFDLAKIYASSDPVRADSCYKNAFLVRKRFFGRIPSAMVDSFEQAYLWQLQQYATFRLTYFDLNEETISPLQEIAGIGSKRNMETRPAIIGYFKWALFWLGNIHLIRNEPEKAFAEHHKLLQLGWQFPYMSKDSLTRVQYPLVLQHLDQAFTYLTKEDAESAYDELQNALDMNDAYQSDIKSFVRYHFGLYYFQHKDFEQAATCFRIAFSQYKKLSKWEGGPILPVKILMVMSATQTALANVRLYAETQDEEQLDEAKDYLEKAETTLKTLIEAGAPIDALKAQINAVNTLLNK